MRSDCINGRATPSLSITCRCVPSLVVFVVTNQVPCRYAVLEFFVALSYQLSVRCGVPAVPPSGVTINSGSVCVFTAGGGGGLRQLRAWPLESVVGPRQSVGGNGAVDVSDAGGGRGKVASTKRL